MKVLSQRHPSKYLFRKISNFEKSSIPISPARLQDISQKKGKRVIGTTGTTIQHELKRLRQEDGFSEELSFWKETTGHAVPEKETKWYYGRRYGLQEQTAEQRWNGGQCFKRPRCHLKRSFHTAKCITDSDNEEIIDGKGYLNGESGDLEVSESLMERLGSNHEVN